MKKLSLIIEKSKDGKLWGRMEFDGDLMVDSANSLDSLERKMKKLLQERAKAIEQIINNLGQELIGIKVAVLKNEAAIKSKNAKREIVQGAGI
ncbi:MAG TPA: hypothetical protein VK543_09790 [Puia sp.]|nr:hypothetical protein [Puia sp.]